MGSESDGVRMTSLDGITKSALVREPSMISVFGKVGRRSGDAAIVRDDGFDN